MAMAEQTVVRPERVGLSSARLERIGPRIQREIEAGSITGAVTLVARRGQIAHLQAHGATSLAGATPVRLDSIFRLASMTKVVTAVAVLMLYEEARLRLSDAVADYLPAFSNLQVAVLSDDGTAISDTQPARRLITIHDLLSHTSGLGSSTTGPLAEAMQRVTRERGPGSTLATFVPALASVPLTFQPGERWEYSGLAGFDTLARVVEIVSNQAFDTFVRDRIFEPLGIRDTSFYLRDEDLPRLVAAYRWADGRLEEVGIPGLNPAARNGTYFSGAGGLAGTAEDYWRFSQMLLNGGELNGERLLGPRTVQLMSLNHIGDLVLRRPDMRGYRFGLGVQVADDVARSRSAQTRGSFGWNGAYSTSFWVDPAEQITHILLTQTQIYPGTANLWADYETLVSQAIVD